MKMFLENHYYFEQIRTTNSDIVYTIRIGKDIDLLTGSQYHFLERSVVTSLRTVEARNKDVPIVSGKYVD